MKETLKPVIDNVVGHGDIASICRNVNRPDLLFFASGVSNSQEVRESEYDREKNLLLRQRLDKRIVYFSSLSVQWSKTRYCQHKLEMEQLIKDTFPKWHIIRLGNLVESTNPHTFINYFKEKIKNNESFPIQDGYRYLTHAKDLQEYMSRIPDFNMEIGLWGKMIKVVDVVKLINKGKL